MHDTFSKAIAFAEIAENPCSCLRRSSQTALSSREHVLFPLHPEVVSDHAKIGQAAVLRRNFPTPRQNNALPAHLVYLHRFAKLTKCFPIEIPQLAPKSLHFALRHAIICLARGGIAQLVERLNGIQEVRGSTPLISTTQDPVELICFGQRVLAGFFVALLEVFIALIALPKFCLFVLVSVARLSRK